MTEREALSAAIENIAARFRSGNRIPVDKAVVPASEWSALVAALAQPVAAEADQLDDRKDAERYRWLREEAQYFSIGRAPAVVLCDEHDLLEKGKTPCEPDGWGFISGGRLDAAIDAARAARPTPA